MKRQRKRKSAGRPRKIDVERHPCGKVMRQRADHGTPEVQGRRQALAGGGDPTKATYPLGILFANGTINESQHNAGCRLAWLYGIVFGRITVAAADYERGRIGGRTALAEDDRDDWRRAREVELKALLNGLEATSRSCRQAVVNVAVFEDLPRWATASIPTVGDVALAQDFMAGIERLEAVALHGGDGGKG